MALPYSKTRRQSQICGNIYLEREDFEISQHVIRFAKEEDGKIVPHKKPITQNPFYSFDKEVLNENEYLDMYPYAPFVQVVSFEQDEKYLELKYHFQIECYIEMMKVLLVQGFIFYREFKDLHSANDKWIALNLIYDVNTEFYKDIIDISELREKVEDGDMDSEDLETTICNNIDNKIPMYIDSEEDLDDYDDYGKILEDCDLKDSLCPNIYYAAFWYNYFLDREWIHWRVRDKFKKRHETEIRNQRFHLGVGSSKYLERFPIRAMEGMLRNRRYFKLVNKGWATLVWYVMKLFGSLNGFVNPVGKVQLKILAYLVIARIEVSNALGDLDASIKWSLKENPERDYSELIKHYEYCILEEIGGIPFLPLLVDENYCLSKDEFGIHLKRGIGKEDGQEAWSSMYDSDSFAKKDELLKFDRNHSIREFWEKDARLEFK